MHDRLEDILLDKNGRNRHYDISSKPEYSDRDIAFMAAYLDELRSRVIDQFEDLPVEALDFVHPKVGFTIGQLALHLAWGELGRLSDFLGAKIDGGLQAVMSKGSLANLGKTLPPSHSAGELSGIIRTSGETVDTLLKRETDPDRSRDDDGSSLRGVLMHLQWHWSFHSGHIGLIRLLWGSDYIWTMHPPLAPKL